MECAYEHRPLDLTKAEIRLLRIGSIETNEVHGFLHHFDVDSAPPYQALSYAWGPPEPTKLIWVDDQPLRIRQNLYEFLRIYQNDRELQTDFLWIDQICIDQQSIPERNHQVQLMAQVFQGATTVLSWLGTCSDAEALAKLVRRLKKSRRYQPFNLTPDERTIWECLIRCSYWKRHWIIQELLLAQACIIVFGKSTIELDKILHLWPGWVARGVGLEAHVLDVIEKTKDWPEAGPLPVRYLTCIMTMQTLCEDPRDQVYGLQSVLPRTLRIPVDYSRSTEEVFVDAISQYYSRRSFEFGHGFEPPVVSTALAMGIVSYAEISDMDKLLAKVRDSPRSTASDFIKTELLNVLEVLRTAAPNERDETR